MNGWIKLHRKIIDWEWFSTNDMLKFFLYLILKANHKDSKFQGHIIKRGQLIIGRKKLAETLNLSEQSIRTCITRLKSTSEITIKSTNKFSIITVCKYELYQSDNNDNQPANQPTS